MIFAKTISWRGLARLVSLAAAAWTSISLAAGAALREGEAFPDLSAFQFDEPPPETKGKVVLIDFFASWCAPCKASFPVMNELQAKYGGRGLVIIAINVDQKKAAFEQFMKRHPAQFTVLRDPEGQAAAKARIQTMPTSFLLDRRGIVRARHDGFEGDATRAKYVSEIESLLR